MIVGFLNNVVKLSIILKKVNINIGIIIVLLKCFIVFIFYFFYIIFFNNIFN